MFILAAARMAVDAMDSILDTEVSVLQLPDMAAVSLRDAAVLIAGPGCLCRMKM